LLPSLGYQLVGGPAMKNVAKAIKAVNAATTRVPIPAKSTVRDSRSHHSMTFCEQSLPARLASLDLSCRGLVSHEFFVHMFSVFYCPQLNFSRIIREFVYYPHFGAVDRVQILQNRIF